MDTEGIILLTDFLGGSTLDQVLAKQLVALGSLSDQQRQCIMRYLIIIINVVPAIYIASLEVAA